MVINRYILLTVFLFFAIHEGIKGQNYFQVKQHPVSTRSYNEVAPIVTRNGIVFCTDITNSSFKSYTDAEGNRFFDIYFARQNEDGGWEKPELFSSNLQTMQNDGPVSMNFNEDLIFFTRNFETVSFGSRMRGNPNLGLYYAEYIDGQWTNITEFVHNNREFNTIHPALDAMGTKLYFASNREGGFGGYDLYVSRKENGLWTEPENLGPAINTAENELYPFVHSSGRLYFSSEGHDNIGGFDIFYSEFYSGRWSRPVKLPTPFNSGLNDFTFYTNEDFDEGLFTSNRRGSLDIFRFESSLPVFDVCKQQVENNYCYVLFEENTISLDTALYLYEWDLGDDTRKKGIEVEHCFDGPGDYVVQLNVIDKLTGMVQFSQAEYLLEVKKVVQPYITSPDTVTVGEEILMNGLESYLGEEEPGEYFWDFGDGEKGVGASVRHTYQIPGVYQIRLGILKESAIEEENAETEDRICSYKKIFVEE